MRLKKKAQVYDMKIFSSEYRKIRQLTDPLTHASIYKMSEEAIDYAISKTQKLHDNSKHAPLLFAVKNKNFYATTQLIKAEVPLNPLDDIGMSPLMIAVKSGHVSICKVLLHAGADPSLRDGDGKTALHHCFGEYIDIDETYYERLQILKTLINNNAAIDAQSKDGITAIMLAARYDQKGLLFEELVRKGADLKLENFLGQTVIHFAIESCRIFNSENDYRLRNRIAKERADALVRKYKPKYHEEFPDQKELSIIEDNLNLFISISELSDHISFGEVAQKLIFDICSDFEKHDRNLVRGELQGYRHNTFYPMNRRPVYKIEIEEKIIIDQTRTSALHLLLNFINPNLSFDKENGRSLLHYAVISGDISLIKRIVHLGGDTQALDNDGLKPVDYSFPHPQRKYYDWKKISEILAPTC